MADNNDDRDDALALSRATRFEQVLAEVVRELSDWRGVVLGEVLAEVLKRLEPEDTELSSVPGDGRVA